MSKTRQGIRNFDKPRNGKRPGTSKYMICITCRGRGFIYDFDNFPSSEVCPVCKGKEKIEYWPKEEVVTEEEIVID
jgi:DnaJ-class molecular chaperone